jgi:hypothetical protein
VAYEHCPRELSGLGLSLKPPQWLRDLASSVAVTVKPPPTTYPLPGGGTVKFQPTPQQLAQQVEQNVPGGWNTVAAVGAGLMLLLILARRR